MSLVILDHHNESGASVYELFTTSGLDILDWNWSIDSVRRFKLTDNYLTYRNNETFSPRQCAPQLWSSHTAFTIRRTVCFLLCYKSSWCHAIGLRTVELCFGRLTSICTSWILNLGLKQPTLERNYETLTSPQNVNSTLLCNKKICDNWMYVDYHREVCNPNQRWSTHILFLRKIWEPCHVTTVPSV